MAKKLYQNHQLRTILPFQMVRSLPEFLTIVNLPTARLLQSSETMVQQLKGFKAFFGKPTNLPVALKTGRMSTMATSTAMAS